MAYLISSARANQKPKFYDNPLHIKFRSGLKLVHAAHYAKGSPSGDMGGLDEIARRQHDD